MLEGLDDWRERYVIESPLSSGRSVGDAPSVGLEEEDAVEGVVAGDTGEVNEEEHYHCSGEKEYWQACQEWALKDHQLL